ncbi:ferredoxin [Dactylosporangium sp. NPDC005572]|uniref:ferredoxin n=1 Tax=Dactylosporangium sp. NPDC005572 TaxID=3156889 RepID=UPI0033B6F396
MKVVADFAKCTGLGICESLLPDRFEVGAGGEVVLLRQDVAEEDRAAVEEAVAGCPTMALRLEP